MISKHADELKSMFGIRTLRLFGSVSRDEQHEGSDVDVCVGSVCVVGTLQGGTLGALVGSALGLAESQAGRKQPVFRLLKAQKPRKNTAASFFLHA